MPSDSATQTSNEPASTLSPQVQTFVSFLIFLHLFALAVGVTSNESPSLLETALRNRTGVRVYLEMMMMDLSYAYAFTFGPSTEPMGDSQSWIEVELTLLDAGPSGRNSSPRRTLPAVATAPLTRILARRGVGQAQPKYRELNSLRGG